MKKIRNALKKYFKKIILFLFIFSLLLIFIDLFFNVKFFKYYKNYYSKNIKIINLNNLKNDLEKREVPEKISKSFCLKDLKILKSNIIKIIPYPFANVDKKTFENEYKNAKEKIKNYKQNMIPVSYFYDICFDFLNSLKISHATMFPIWYYNEISEIVKNKYKTVLVKIFYDINSNNIYLTGYYDLKSEQFKIINNKWRIDKINGISKDLVFEKMYNNTNIYNKKSSIKTIFESNGAIDYIYLFHKIFENPEKFVFDIYDENEKKKIKLILKTKNLSYYINNLDKIKKDSENNFSINTEKYFEIKIFDDKLNKFYVSDKLKTIYIKFISFGGNGFGGLIYNLRDIKNIKEKYNIENIIIDIRNNPGGNFDNGKFLNQYLFKNSYYLKIPELVKIKKNILLYYPYENYYTYFKNKQNRIINFNLFEYFKINKFKIIFKSNINFENIKNFHLFKSYYLIQNLSSLSSSMLYSLLFKKYNLGKIIGEETGDLRSINGDQTFFYLPNSNLIYCLPILFNLPLNYNNKKHGVLPDIEVHQTIDDLLKGKDTILEYTLNLIEKERK